MISAENFPPTEVGANLIAIWQVAAGDNAPVQLLLDTAKSAEFMPPMVTMNGPTAEDAVLVRGKKVGMPLLVPTAWLPKSAICGEIARADVPAPVPVSVALVIPVLPETVSVAVLPPGASGANCTTTEQVPPADNEAPPQVLASITN